MPGILAGGLLAGAATGAQREFANQEKQQALDQAQSHDFAMADYRRKMADQEAQDKQARLAARMQDFKAAAADWRNQNPSASMNDFIAHFSDTEYADLLGPSLSAANLMSAADVRKAQDAHWKAQEDLQRLQIQQQGKYQQGELDIRRQEAAKANAANDKTSKLTDLAIEKYNDAKAEEATKQGLISGYLALKNTDPAGAEIYRDELRARFNMDPGVIKGEKTGGSDIEKTTTAYDAQGNEIKTKETSKGGTVVAGPSLGDKTKIPGATFRDNTTGKMYAAVYRGADGTPYVTDDGGRTWRPLVKPK